MFNLGTPELIIILSIGLLLFGKKLPDLARSLGKSLLEFRKSVSGMEDDIASTPMR